MRQYDRSKIIGKIINLNEINTIIRVIDDMCIGNTISRKQTNHKAIQ